MNLKLKFILILMVVSWVLFVVAIVGSTIRILQKPKIDELVVYKGRLVEYQCYSNLQSQSYFRAVIRISSGDSKKLIVKGNCKSITPNLNSNIFVTARLNPRNLEVWELYFDDIPIVTSTDSIIRLYIALVFGGLLLGGAAISFSIIYLKLKKKGDRFIK